MMVRTTIKNAIKILFENQGVLEKERDETLIQLNKIIRFVNSLNESARKNHDRITKLEECNIRNVKHGVVHVYIADEDQEIPSTKIEIITHDIRKTKP